VSRDGSTIVFYDYDASTMWKMDADGRNRTSLGPRLNQVMTPDGRQLVFVDAPAGQPAAVRIRSIDATGEPRVVTTDRVRGGTALASPDGRWIAYPSFDDEDRPALAVCDLATCASRRILPIPGTVEWTPDSRGLAYLEPRLGSDIFVQPIDGGPPRQLTHFPADGQQIWRAAWTPDGKRIAVARAAAANNIVLFRGLRAPAR
jgi:Tol biopolymer transport system component